MAPPTYPPPFPDVPMGFPAHPQEPAGFRPVPGYPQQHLLGPPPNIYPHNGMTAPTAQTMAPTPHGYHQFGDVPVYTVCPTCNQPGQTLIRYEPGVTAW
eukprot:CAMPEP_0118937850 /NCGR_PEP_ID=MMETSP1169-20130426/23963_1 /TAXON_ID=36882 /ORGANISM="Pyramimonas obovata, Strain CCMP722" /LENGTH=98 /DNA_ID=CAMNT_0006881605 /DNA_START=359 /DNA_END=652 /DNA_ORIENTATION=+